MDGRWRVQLPLRRWPLSIGGTFKAEQVGYLTVTLETIDSNSGRRVPIMSCGSVSTTFGACGSFATESPTVSLEVGQKLFCTVQGADRGRYRCNSART